MENDETENPRPLSSPHVLMFPLPIQGPVKCMLKLANLILFLTHNNQPTTTVSVTFLTTNFIYRRLTRHSSSAVRLARDNPNFRFETVPDGLDEFDDDESPRGGLQLVKVVKFLEEEAQRKGSRLREVLADGSAEPGEKKPVSCLIADGLYGFMADVAQELKVPLVYFETISPCGLWTYLCLPRMVQAGDLPFQDNNLDTPITSVPGMESYLRRRDLPSFYRTYDPENPRIQLILKLAQNFPRAQGHILNTFDELEPHYFSHLRTLCPNLYTIGPIHLNLKCKIVPNSFSDSLWPEDKSCLVWLDAQPPKSVLFVSFGSLATLTKEQLIEIWYGVVNSMTRFLWVRRPGLIIKSNHEEDDKELDALEGIKDRCCVVSWVPQEEVLAHRAIGGFLTHSGWNSSIESIVEGVPMICWPFFVDQQVNSRLVSEVWRIGLDMKDICDRIVVEKMVKDLMGRARVEFLKRANELAKLAAQAVAEGGSSYTNLNRLIDNIKLMRFPIPISNNV